MGLTAPLRLEVAESSGVAPARRAAVRLAHELQFSEADAGRVAVVASELATNLVRHAQRGEMILRKGSSAPGQSDRVDIIAWDRGPGMPDIGRCMRDGFSTGGGPGNGLGAVERMSDSFELHSTTPGGTVAVARIGKLISRVADGLALAVAPETVSGDAWALCEAPGGASVLLADGLGHGPGAAEASELAAAVLAPGQDVVETLERVHDALRSTRGAAVAVARVDHSRGILQFAGAGNISAVLCSRDSAKTLTSLSGTAGRQMKTLRSFDYELPESGLLVLHSDGCRTGWDLSRDPILRRRDPLMIASALIRDWERGRDDVSVIVMPVAKAQP